MSDDNDSGSTQEETQRPQDALLGRPQDALKGRGSAAASDNKKKPTTSASKSTAKKSATPPAKDSPPAEELPSADEPDSDQADAAATAVESDAPAKPKKKKKAAAPAPAPQATKSSKSPKTDKSPKVDKATAPDAEVPAAAVADDNVDPDERRADRALGWFIGSTVVLGFALRIIALGERALHHDESLDAWWSYRYLNGTYDGYDPIYHGPLRFYITALFYWLFGESPATSRLFSALAGTALIAVAWFLRHHIGRIAAGVTAVLLCLSPSLLYYSRFGREDAQIVFLTGVMLALTIAYFHKPRAWQPSAIALALSASLAIKESTYLLIFTVGSFVLVVMAVQFHRLANDGGKPTKKTNKSADVVAERDGFTWQLPVAALAGMVIAVILAAQSSAFVMFGLYGVVLLAIAALMAFRATQAGARLTDAPLIAKAAEVGGRPWAIAGGLLVFTFIAFFTVWFTRPGDWHTGVTEAISYWDSQQEVNRGGQPWYYYFVLMPAYEWVAVFLAFIGAVVAFQKRSFALGLIGWLAVSNMIVYSYAGERMPWLVVHPLLPVLILAGVGTQVLWTSRAEIAPKVALGALGLGFAFTVFTGLRLAFPNGADGRELMVQGAQATEHVPVVRDHIEALEDIGRSELGREPSVAIGGELAWPWGWYFRDIGYLPFTDSADLPDNDIILLAASQPITDDITANYTVTKFALRGWWVPAWVSKEVTRTNETTGLEETTTESSVGGYFAGGLGGWADWQVSREAWPEREGAGIGCGSADQYLLVRKDLAAAADRAIGLGILEPLEIEKLPCVSADLRTPSP